MKFSHDYDNRRIHTVDTEWNLRITYTIPVSGIATKTGWMQNHQAPIHDILGLDFFMISWQEVRRYSILVTHSTDLGGNKTSTTSDKTPHLLLSVENTAC